MAVFLNIIQGIKDFISTKNLVAGMTRYFLQDPGLDKFIEILPSSLDRYLQAVHQLFCIQDRAGKLGDHHCAHTLGASFDYHNQFMFCTNRFQPFHSYQTFLYLSSDPM